MDIKDKIRKFIFPDISNWSSSHDELRYREEWWKMSTMKYIFFHHLGTKWFIFGINSVGTLMFSVGGIYIGLKYSWGWGIIPLVIAAFLFRATILKLRSWKKPTVFTLYDIILRDYNG